jgi:signal transduction histidine kinase
MSMIQVLLLASADQSIIMNTLTQILTRFLVFIVAGAVIVMLSERKRQQQRELAQKNAQLAHYISTLEELAISRERNRMARELHDTLAHTLSALNVQIKALDVLWESDSPRAGQMIRQMQEITHSAINESRRALHALRASHLEELGLTLALQRLAERIAEQEGMRLTLNIQMQIEGIEPEVEQQFYRIAEEALSNVVRHAHARSVVVTLYQSETEIKLIIADDGGGFDIEAGGAAGHYGIIGMRERAGVIDATLDISSCEARGTTVQLWKTVERGGR